MDAGNVSRATDGLVLGEQIAIEMGGDPEDVQLFPLQAPPSPEPVQLHNYCYGEAQSGREPMLEDEVSTFQVGFKQHVRADR